VPLPEYNGDMRVVKQSFQSDNHLSKNCFVITCGGAPVPLGNRTQFDKARQSGRIKMANLFIINSLLTPLIDLSEIIF